MKIGHYRTSRKFFYGKKFVGFGFMFDFNIPRGWDVILFRFKFKLFYCSGWFKIETHKTASLMRKKIDKRNL